MKADSELGHFIPDLVKLYESDLVVDASYVKQNKRYFWVKVNAVIRDSKFGIKPGDYLRIVNQQDGGCGFLFDIANYRRSMLYLQKRPNTWELYARQTASVYLIREDTSYFTVGTRIHYDRIASLRADLLEFQDCYGMYNEHRRFYPHISDSLLAQKAKHNKIIESFEDNKRITHQEDLVHLESEIQAPQQTQRSIQFCSFMDQEPEFPGGESGLRVLIKDEVKHPMPELRIEGKVIVKFLIEEDGVVGDSVEILRGINSLLDNEAVRIVRDMPTWQPARKRGRNQACYMILPVTFRSEE